jgi:hypothetical protein
MYAQIYDFRNETSRLLHIVSLHLGSGNYLFMCAGTSVGPAIDTTLKVQRRGRSSAPAMLQRSNRTHNPGVHTQHGSMDLFALSDSSQCTTSQPGTALKQAASHPKHSAGCPQWTQPCAGGRSNQCATTPVPAAASAEGIAVVRAGKMFLKVRMLF